LTQQALCKVAYVGQRSPVVGASRSLARPTHRHLSPYGCACMVALVRRFAQCFQSAASPCHVVLAPAHPWRSLASQASPARSARPPPKGAPSEPRCKTAPNLTFFLSNLLWLVWLLVTQYAWPLVKKKYEPYENTSNH